LRLEIVRIIRWIFALIIGVLLVSFALYNSAVISVKVPVLSSKLEAPVFLVIFAALAAGVILGGLSSLFYRIKGIGRGNAERKRIKELEREVEVLKSEVKTIDSTLSHKSDY